MLAPYECCHSKQSSLTQAIQQHLRELVAAEASSFLQRSGLQGLLSWHRFVLCSHHTDHCALCSKHNTLDTRFHMCIIYVIRYVGHMCLCHGCLHCWHMMLAAIQVLCNCRESQSYHWDLALPDVNTGLGAQQLVHSLNSFSELITQDQLPQFRQMQVSVHIVAVGIHLNQLSQFAPLSEVPRFPESGAFLLTTLSIQLSSDNSSRLIVVCNACRHLM